MYGLLEMLGIVAKKLIRQIRSKDSRLRFEEDLMSLKSQEVVPGKASKR